MKFSTAIWRRGLHIGSAHQRSRPACRIDRFAGKRSRGNGFPISERVRVLQPLLPRPQEGWWSKTSESRPYETAIKDDYIEADPLANMPRGLVLFTGSERHLISHPDCPSPQAVPEIRLRGSGLLIHGPPLRAIPGSLHFYEAYGCGSFPAETGGNPLPKLPWRLAHFGPVRGRASISQIRAPQPLRLPRTHQKVTKQRLSRWIIDTFTLAYSSLGQQCPMGVRAHSTRGIASSWAWSSGVSIAEICAAAGWASPSPFARFYNMEVPALQARVLSA